MRAKGYEAYLFKSIKGIWMSMRAASVFETEGNQDVIGYAIGKTKIIQLWHGMSVKRLDSMDRMEGGSRTLYSRIVSGDREDIYYMVSSEECGNQFKEVFHTDDAHIRVTGFPRNDTFILKPKNTFMDDFRNDHPGCKIIIYMPTHRNFGQGNKLVNTIDNLKYVNDKLKANNIYMIYKPHFHEMKNFLKYESELSNIIIASDSKIFGDVYSYLYDCDLLISDYSSVMNDFVCADKPIISFPYDLKDYSTADMGIYEFYEKMSPGSMYYTWEDVVRAVIEALEKDTWRFMRIGTKSFYHIFSDGKNCERVYRSCENCKWLIGRGKLMKRIITYGTFDLLHYGHINLLRRAKALGDYLIVALSTDEFNWNEKKKKCYFSYEERKILLEALRYVDLVIPERSWEQKKRMYMNIM